MEGKEKRCVKYEMTVLDLTFPRVLTERGRGSWMVGGQWAGQGLCRLGSKVNVVRTLHKVCTIKDIFMGPLALVMQ